MRNKTAVIITCEHAGNRVPPEYMRLFKGKEKILSTHHACDTGALPVARSLARRLRAPLFFSTVTRQVVDANRSPDSPELFSQFTSKLPDNEKKILLSKYYGPYRRRVENAVAERIQSGRRVLHISVHSFTPVLDGEVRTADAGLLFDPRRETEKRICGNLRESLRAAFPGYRIKFNYPYKGISDGFTTYLRKKYRDPVYSGIEIEINQKLLIDNPAARQRIAEAIFTAVGNKDILSIR